MREIIAEFAKPAAGALSLTLWNGSECLGMRTVIEPGAGGVAADQLPALAEWVMGHAAALSAHVTVLPPVPVYLVGAKTVTDRLSRVLDDFDGVAS